MIPPEQHYNDDQPDKMLVKIVVFCFFFFTAVIFVYTMYHLLNIELCLHIQNFLLSHWVCDHCHKRSHNCAVPGPGFPQTLCKSKHSPYLYAILLEEDKKRKYLQPNVYRIVVSLDKLLLSVLKLKIWGVRIRCHWKASRHFASSHLHRMRRLPRLSNAIKSYLCPSKKLKMAVNESPVDWSSRERASLISSFLSTHLLSLFPLPLLSVCSLVNGFPELIINLSLCLCLCLSSRVPAQRGSGSCALPVLVKWFLTGHDTQITGQFHDLGSKASFADTFPCRLWEFGDMHRWDIYGYFLGFNPWINAESMSPYFKVSASSWQWKAQSTCCQRMFTKPSHH